MNRNNQSNVDHQQRVCQLYGICGKSPQYPQSYQVAQFGLHCLTRKKER